MPTWLENLAHETISVILGSLVSGFILLVKKLWRDLNEFFRQHRELSAKHELLAKDHAELKQRVEKIECLLRSRSGDPKP